MTKIDWLHHEETTTAEAISALQEQEAKHSEDTISRQAAIDAADRADYTGLAVEDVKKVTDEVVKELKQLPSAQPEPCDDAVSREAAIDVAENAFVRGLLASPDIRRLPPAQPEPQWISVTERLPESKPEDLEYPTVIACCEDGEVMTACYYESTKEWGIGENYDRKINPVAWMPLPEPYRAERRTDDMQ